MKNTTALAAVAVALLAGAAQADFIVSFPGTHTFNSGGGQFLTANAVTGTLTGIRVSFTYQHLTGSSCAYDVAFTVNQHQWGGYLPFINGAGVGETQTGAPSLPGTITFTSANLGMGYGHVFNNQTAYVGFGNGNQGGGCVISDVTVTLLGVVPTPGAAAALSLGGLCLGRRRR